MARRRPLREDDEDIEIDNEIEIDDDDDEIVDDVDLVKDDDIDIGDNTDIDVDDDEDIESNDEDEISDEDSMTLDDAVSEILKKENNVEDTPITERRIRRAGNFAERARRIGRGLRESRARRLRENVMNIDQVVSKVIGERKTRNTGFTERARRIGRSIRENREQKTAMRECNKRLNEKVARLEAKLCRCAEEKDNEVKAITESMKRQVAREVAKQVKTLSERATSYVDYVAEQYTKNRQDVIKESSKVLLAEGVLNSVKKLFETYGFSLKEGDRVLKDELRKTKSELKEAYEKLGNVLDSKQELNNRFNQLSCKVAFDQLTEGLSEIDKNRISRLVRGDSCDVKEYRSKVKTLVENLQTENTPIRRRKTIVSDRAVPKVLSESVRETRRDGLRTRRQALTESRKLGSRRDSEKTQFPEIDALAKAIEKLS